MKFTSDETQIMLRDTVRRFVEKDYRHAEDPLGHDDATWGFVAEQGWIAAGLPEAAGGLGGDLFDTCLIAEELGRGLVREAYVPFAATAHLLVELDPGSSLLEALTWGSSRPLLAHNEASMRGRSDRIETVARKSGDGFAISGEKSAVLGSSAATHLLVSARIDGEDGTTVFLVDPAAAGVTVQSFRTVDNRGAAHVRLESVQVADDAIVGARGEAQAAIDAALDRSLIAASAEALGAMEAALFITRDYLNTRKQFGVPIGDFQALRHRLADMFIETEQARSIILRAVGAVGSGDRTEATRLAAAAKARVGKAAHYVGGQAIQLHGGIGVTEEYTIGHFYKRLVTYDLHGGAASAHLERFAEQTAELPPA